MCKDCFVELVYRFESQDNFEKVEENIREKTGITNLEVVERPLNNYTAASNADFIYRCSTCGERWILSIPQNAWRGYLLTEQKAIEHSNQLKASDKKKRKGCLLLLIIILLLVTLYLVR